MSDFTILRVRDFTFLQMRKSYFWNLVANVWLLHFCECGCLTSRILRTQMSEFCSLKDVDLWLVLSCECCYLTFIILQTCMSDFYNLVDADVWLLQICRCGCLTCTSMEENIWFYKLVDASICLLQSCGYACLTSTILQLQMSDFNSLVNMDADVWLTSFWKRMADFCNLADADVWDSQSCSCGYLIFTILWMQMFEFNHLADRLGVN